MNIIIYVAIIVVGVEMSKQSNDLVGHTEELRKANTHVNLYY